MEETEVGALFPTQGVDATCEYMRQPDGTTPDCENVRAHDQLEERARGGSRPGLSQYVPQQVAGERWQVQHLNVLVDPQQPALSGNFETDDPSTTNGPYRVPGRKMRAKGNGRRPRAPDSSSTGSPITFVAKLRDQPGNINSPYTVTVPGSPIVDDLILVFVRTEHASPARLPESVRNTAGIDLNQAGDSGNEHAEVTSGGTTVTLSCWWKPYDNADDNEITVTPGSLAIYEIVVLVYRNANPDGAVSNDCKLNDGTSDSTFTLPDLELDDTTGQLVVAAFTLINTTLDAVTTGYVERVGTVSSTAGNFAVIERSNLSGVGPENPAISVLVDAPWAGFAVALTNQ